MASKKRAELERSVHPRTLGPLTELENHLPPEWWKTLFNALYLKTDADVVEDNRITGEEIDFILRNTGAVRGDRILDLCCGQGRHSLELLRRGYKLVTGVDRSRYLIRLAKQRAQRESLAGKFHEGDARKLRFPENSFDVVLVLGNSFGYFDMATDDAAVLKRVRTVLRAGGTLLLDLANGAWLRDNFQRRSWEWIDKDQFVCRERELTTDSRLISREVIVDAEKGVIADQFYAERLYDEASIAELLLHNGFEQVRFNGGHATQSERNQDLGMMEHRIWVTAVNKPKRTRKKVVAVPYPKVTVLLGDPHLPDEVKLNGQFNEEDFITVDKLKSALAGLGDYSFSYMNDHTSLLQELITNPPEFVFNLCDEGYWNDPLKELHVPAMLEMLKVPYTGAGPACLGICYNKNLVSAIATSVDVPVPAESLITEQEMGGTIPAIYPALLKPAKGDSSFGINMNAVVNSPEEAIEQIAYIKNELGVGAILIQEFLQGTEVSVTLVGNPDCGYTYLPILEVDYSELPPDLPKILSYESKWEPDSPYWTQIRYREYAGPEDRQRLLYDYSARLFERLECRDYARFDFRFDGNGVPKLLEVNPNPGWCWDGKLNLMNEMAGKTYKDLLEMILTAAQRRVKV